MLWNVSVMLRALTLNIDRRYTKPIHPIFFALTILISVSYFYTYLISMVWFVTVRCRETGDMVAAMVLLSLGIASEIGSIKMILMYMNKRKIRNIVDGYRACNALVTPGSRFSKNLLIHLRSVKKRAVAFWLVNIFNGLAYVIKPCFLKGRHFPDDSFVLYGLEPKYATPYYQTSYTLVTLSALFTVYIPANVTAFMLLTVGYTESQLLALSQELIHVWDDAKAQYSETSNDSIITESSQSKNLKKKTLKNYVKKNLERIVAVHTLNINLIRKVETLFRGAIAIEFIFLIAGVITELLGGLENTYIELPFTLMQVAIDCLAGQRLIDASGVFEDAVYDCKWENFDVRNRKTVLLMLRNAQKTMTISAGGVSNLSFTCLMSVIRAIYSAYTALRSTMSLSRGNLMME